MLHSLQLLFYKLFCEITTNDSNGEKRILKTRPMHFPGQGKVEFRKLNKNK